MIDYRSLANALSASIIAWRRDFHQHPELGFQEFRTAGIVAEHLNALGVETSTGVGKTGVVGIIEGARPGPTVLLRFDMDALPVTEETGLPFASQHPGLMHACGHDGHTAIGMGVAQLLVETREQWAGRIKLLFQPAEEGLGGAAATVRDGVLENPKPDAAFALHLWNQIPSGQFVVQEGPFMAAADSFEISIIGRGGHGAVPEDTIDAVLVGAEAVNALQTIISRNVSPHETAVLTIGSFRAGQAFNVIAERAVLRGTIRTFDPTVRALIIRRIREILTGVTQAHGASFTFDLKDDEYTPAVINDLDMADIAREAARQVLSPEQITQIRPLMVSEDMSEILNRVPGCYVLLGAEPEGGARGPHHNPKFDINEDALPLAAAIMANIATTYTERGSAAANG